MIEEVIEKTKKSINTILDKQDSPETAQEVLYLSQALNEMQKHKDYVERQNAKQVYQERQVNKQFEEWKNGR